jgi:hypothetical protein
MAAELEILIDIQTGESIRELGKFNDKLENFSAASVNSLKDLENTLEQVRDAAKNINLTQVGGIDQLEAANKTIKELQATIDRLKATGKGGVFDVSDQARRSRIALNDLSRVAQDLPFGFIGIQNNIPQLVNSFSELRKDSKTTGEALRALAAGITGPAGLLFAFSVVTSLITVVIQKYGSLGNAIDALTSGNTKLYEAQKKYNEGLAESARKVGELRAEFDSYARITDNYNSAQRLFGGVQDDIIDRAKKYVGYLDDEKVAKANLGLVTAELIKLEEAYGQKKLQTTAISQLSEQLDQLTKSGVKGVPKVEIIIAALEQLAIAFNPVINQSEALYKGEKSLGSALFEGKLNSTTSALNKYKGELDATNIVIEEAKKALQKLLGGNKADEEARENAAKAAETQAKAIEKADKAMRDYINTLSAKNRLGDDFGGIVPPTFTFEDLALLNKGVSLLTAAEEAAKKVKDAFGNVFSQPTTSPEDGKLKGLPTADELAKLTEEQKKYNEELAIGVDIVSGILQPAFEDLFNTLIEGGENAFGNFIKGLAKMIAKMVVAIGVALALKYAIQSIPGLGPILAGIGNIQKAAFGSDGFSASIASILKGFSRTQSANLNGITGGLGFSANNFTLSTTVRGQDLVFVMNRAGQTYGRTV